MTNHTPSLLGHYSDGALSAVSDQDTRPKQLLDLPVEILNAILKELNHTNDLTSLALCHSTLHSLTVSHIYSRFDIVWPDNASGPEPRAGVDALTYGLSTLVMAEDIFSSCRGQSMEQRVKRRRGNHFASFTKKFSLGNGPPEWVQDYLITKEGGKMLGTLVALAVARMRNLESFTWDMPTGVLNAVWDALSSLGDHEDDKPCRLDRVAVRWHDNSVESRSAPIHIPRRPHDTPPPLSALQHVENPSFSILPPLRSLSVLDIDEVQYLDELSVLIQRSFGKLRELRLGIAPHARHREFVSVWEGENVRQIDRFNPVMSCITIGEKRLGGVLGVLTGLIFDLRSAQPQSIRSTRLRRRSNVTIGNSQMSGVLHGASGTAGTNVTNNDFTSSGTGVESIESTLVEDSPDDEIITGVEHVQASTKSILTDDPVAASPAPLEITDEHPLASLPHRVKDLSDMPDIQSSTANKGQLSSNSSKLGLDALELEQVPLSIPILMNAIDWSTLTTITLLHCPNHEHLWKALRRQFSPASKSKHGSTIANASSALTCRPLGTDTTYRLNLKHIFTDTVSSSLISFIKDTLRPNSLESVFFLHASSYNSTVSLDTIFNGVLRRHRTSLRKVLIDSGEKGAENSPGANAIWRQWMFNREVLKFLGRMPQLRELGVALDYRDWHFFLQHLPSLPKLRSLYIPFLVNFTQPGLADTRELALQIVDIVALRPELEICYLGIMKKCFEVLEQKTGPGKPDHHSNNGVDDHSGSEDVDDDDEEDSGDEDDGDDDDDDDDDSEDTASDTTDTYEDSESGLSENEKEVPALRLREILYYDDKVSVFKARHGRL